MCCGNVARLGGLVYVSRVLTFGGGCLVKVHLKTRFTMAACENGSLKKGKKIFVERLLTL